MAEVINNEELEVLEAEADQESSGLFRIDFRRPFSFEGKTYEALEFDFGGLTGNDGLAVENELTALGKAVAIRELNSEYQIRIAARACTEPISADMLMAMPLRDCNRVLNKVRGFLLNAVEF